MSNCQLTAKDSFVLKALLSEPGHPDDLRTIVREKLRSASLFLDHTIDRKVATIGSRVRYAVGDTPHERVLIRHAVATPGLELSVSSLVGAALVGMREGQISAIRHTRGEMLHVQLIKVLSQPEAQLLDPATATVVVHVDFTKTRQQGSRHPRHHDDGPGAA